MKNFILSAFADEYDTSFVAQLEGLKKFEIDFIELRFIDEKNIADLDKNEVARVKKLLSDFNIGASAIGSPLGKISLDDDFDAHLEKATRVFQAANELDCKNIRMFSFYPKKDTAIEADKDEVFEKLYKLADLASKYGVLLCHENEAKIFGESPNNCKEILTAFDGKIKCVFDMGNFCLDGFAPYPAYELLSDHIEYFHIKDALSAGAIVPAGKGEAQIKEILSAHKNKMKNDTFITLEPHLQTFSGLNALTDSHFDNPYKYPDGHASFTDAVICLREILNNI